MDDILDEMWDNRELGADAAFVSVAELTPEQQATIDKVAAELKR